MTIARPRATGYYATWLGREYHATTHGPQVILRSYRGEPSVIDFSPSRISSVQGIRIVSRAELESLAFVRTVCTWRGEPFLVVGVADPLLFVLYTGDRGEWACQQTGMVRTGKLETHGRVDIADVDEIFEFVDPLAV